MLSVELHAHSELSYDGRDPVELLLEQAEAVGLDGLAVTDHDGIEASLSAAAVAREYDLVGIPGMEVSSAAGHVLALGVEELVPAGLPFEETLERIHELGGIAVVPHPFQSSRHGVAAHVTSAQLAGADAIEVYNSRLFTGRSNSTPTPNCRTTAATPSNCFSSRRRPWDSTRWPSPTTTA